MMWLAGAQRPPAMLLPLLVMQGVREAQQTL
jgi:hypothetical protein